jgi:hypothetical protein
MLDPDPANRPTADEVLRRAARDLQSLAGRVAGPFFRPWEELDQFELHLCKQQEMPLVPQEKWLNMRDRLLVLRQGLSRNETDELITDLLAETRAVLGTVKEPDVRAELNELVDELERQREPERETVYEALVEDLRQRLEHRADGWPELAPDSREALNTPLQPEFRAYFSESTRAKARLLLELLERRKALPAY